MSKLRRYKREVTDPDVIRQILEDCTVVRLGLQDAEGMFVIPLNFGYEYFPGEAIRLYIHSAKEGRKAAAFAKCSQAAVELDCQDGLIRGDYACGYSMAYRSIMGSGVVRKLETNEEKIHGLTLLMGHLAPGASMDFQKQHLDAADIYCVEVREFTAKMRRPQSNLTEGGKIQ